MVKVAGGVAALLLAGCTYGGHYVRSGPCEGWRTDSAACERAATNRGRIDQVRIGMPMNQVRELMGSPERRDAAGDRERWGYLTDYDGERITTITFVANVVSSIELGPAGL